MKKTTLFAFALIFVLALAACGNKNNDSGSASSTSPAASSAAASETPSASPSESAAASSEAPAEVKKIVVGTGSQFPKVAFLDDSGKLTGFDVELVREIDKRLPEYEFELQVLEFKNILLSLETKKIDLAAHEFEKNPEREAKYLFNKEAYAHWKNKIIVAKTNNDPIESLDDLKGKKFFTSPTSAEAQILENYNKDHDNALKIVYSSGGANDIVSQITSGRVDATVGADFVLPILDPEGKLKTVGKELSEADILFLFRKNDPDQQKLADAVDKAIVEIKADGTLAKLSTEWLGFDATTSEK
ncbi:transporter substrate-binding domain-containing protein [Cohnella silvisoli]|uniref:Transporter substrate-binding domain-containing protein n=1 Tax=Cohnella silvisoli TaxID=2873699 RepID=A0ABV1KTC3_9BACL|nr:transporter substrate-binding domain-containing protein [Cohnella silvisoli]MCD9022908.1 transporter substrate-binding domain-containing protein [Cohnella silvisoli]